MWTSVQEPARSRSGLFLCRLHPSSCAEFSHETAVWFHFPLLGWFPFFGLHWLYAYTLYTGSSFQMSIVVFMSIGTCPEFTSLSCSLAWTRLPCPPALSSHRGSTWVHHSVFSSARFHCLRSCTQTWPSFPPEISQFRRPTFQQDDRGENSSIRETKSLSFSLPSFEEHAPKNPFSQHL